MFIGFGLPLFASPYGVKERVPGPEQWTNKKKGGEKEKKKKSPVPSSPLGI